MVADHDATPPYTWFQPLQPYIKSEQVFKCPSLGSETTSPDPNTDYIINGFFAHGVSQALFQSTAEQIMVVEREKDEAVFDYHPWDEDGAGTDFPNSTIFPETAILTAQIIYSPMVMPNG